jgi:hypothetical protein
MRGKSDVSGLSGLSGEISSDHELGDYLRLVLHAAVEPLEPADGLKRIRARLARRAAGRFACRRPAEMPARRPRCRWWPGG